MTGGFPSQSASNAENVPFDVASGIVHQDALAYLNSVRAWARLFHVAASGGLNLSQQSSNRRKVGLWNSLVRGQRYVTLAKWVAEVGHLDWVPAPAASPRNQSIGHWPPSSLGNFSMIKETHFCGANCVALCSANCFFDNYIYTRYIKPQITWIGVLVHIPTFVIWT